MICGDYNFDMARALSDTEAPIYYDTYYASNEPLDWEMGLVPVAGRRVLTVAASGDQPLLYATHGASHVDTFDLSICSKAIMDFKTAALQTMDMSQYYATISKMFDLDRAAADNPLFSETLKRMPADTCDMMTAFSKSRINVFCRDIINPIPVPADNTEYETMRSRITRPFNFIWADLMRVPYLTTEQYDVINVSNIFDHYSQAGRDHTHMIKTVALLWHRLNIGGHIVCLTPFSRYSTIRPLAEAMSIPDLAQTTITDEPDGSWAALVIQKIR